MTDGFALDYVVVGGGSAGCVMAKPKIAAAMEARVTPLADDTFALAQ